MAFTYFAAFNPLVSKVTYRFQTRTAASDVVFLNWGYEEIRRWPCRSRNAMSRAGSPFSSITAPRPRST